MSTSTDCANQRSRSTVVADPSQSNPPRL
jgi:hypothetical protein